MTISTEAIIGIVSIFVGLPPILLIFWSLRRRMDNADRTIAVVDDDHIPTLERTAIESTSRMVVVVVLQTTRTQVAGGATGL
ncbi:hypothetical protein BDD12DRAFT_841768 [Trichophaea hybrida]|nr:hypothetical protein BDD12DRAFT_841768 [Trichophaea hybrida]